MEPGWYPHPQDPSKQIYWTGTTWTTTGPIDNPPTPPALDASGVHTSPTYPPSAAPVSVPAGIHHKLPPATGLPQNAGVYSPGRQNSIIPVFISEL